AGAVAHAARASVRFAPGDERTSVLRLRILRVATTDARGNRDREVAVCSLQRNVSALGQHHRTDQHEPDQHTTQHAGDHANNHGATMTARFAASDSPWSVRYAHGYAVWWAHIVPARNCSARQLATPRQQFWSHWTAPNWRSARSSTRPARPSNVGEAVACPGGDVHALDGVDGQKRRDSTIAAGWLSAWISRDAAMPAVVLRPQPGLL